MWIGKAEERVLDVFKQRGSYGQNIEGAAPSGADLGLNAYCN